MADGAGEVERLTTVFDADFKALDAKLNAIIRAQYGAADKISGAWKKSQADAQMAQALAQQSALKNIQLENQLAIARAAGDKSRIKALTEELLLERQLQALRRAGVTGDAANLAARSHVSALSEAEKSREAGGLGKALDSVFDSSKLAVIEEGSAKLRVFGSAIEPLGAWGIAAAVGVVALVTAIESVKKAMEEVGALQVKADKLGIPVEQLQELEFAAKESHISVEKLDSDLGALTDTIGRLQSGVGAARLNKLADELKLTPADLAGMKTAADLLPVLADRIKALPTLAEQYAAASKAGVVDLLPLLLKGGDAIRDLTEEYRALGIEVSGPVAEAVARGNVEMERAHDIAHDKLRNSLIELHPIIENLSTAWDDFAAHAVDAFSKAVEAAKIGFGALGLDSFGGRGAGGGLGDDAPQAPDGLPSGGPGRAGAHAPGSGAPGGKPAPTQAMIDAEAAATEKLDELEARYVTHTTQELEARKKIAEINAKREAAGDADLPQGEVDKILSAARAQDAKPGERAQSAAARKAAEAQRKAAEAALKHQEEIDREGELVDAAVKAELAARLALVTDVQKAADMRKAEIDADAKKAKDKAVSDFKEGKIDGLTAAALQAKADQLAVEKKRLIDAQTADAQARTAADVARIGLDAQVATLESQKLLALTADQRRALELKILEIQQEEAKARAEAVLASQTATDAEKQLAQATLDSLPVVNAAQRAQVIHNTQGPLEQFQSDAAQSSANFGQTEQVKVYRDLASGLAQAAVDAKNLRDIAKGVFKKIATDMIEQLITSEEAKVLTPAINSAGSFLGSLFHIPGFAEGTRDSPGGLAVVGEKGPELINLPRHSQVIPRNQIGRLANTPAKPVAAPTLVSAPYFDNRGAVMTDDLLAQMDAKAALAQRQAVSQSLALSRANLSGASRSLQLLEG